jgi:ATP synthase F1 gamma subunit
LLAPSEVEGAIDQLVIINNMANQKFIEVEISSLSSLHGVVETYKEIAATRITRTRHSVLKGREFLNEINQIFLRVKSSYRMDVERLMKEKKIKNKTALSFVKKNGKTVYIFLSANTGLYGDVVRRTFKEFRQAAQKAKNEGNHVAVIGRLGLFLMREAGLSDPYRYFDFPDQTVDDRRLHEIALFLIEYEKIVVYYQEFKTVVKQETVISDISGNPLSAEGENEGFGNIKYLFEPSLEKVLEFFEKEIFSSIFEQTIRDSQLAKFASRLVSLDTASENIKKKLSRMVFDVQRLRHREKNKKQSQTFSSMRLWK